jgi:hypothetical protein
LSFVAKRKRVISVAGKELDLGTYYLRDWLQPNCYAVANQLVGKVMEKWSSLTPEQQQDAVKTVGFGNALVKIAWNLVNTEVRYRYDEDLFNQADFWMMPAETWTMRFGDCEDTSFLLASSILRLFEIVGDFQLSWWYRWFNRDAPNCQVWLGFVYQDGQYFGHAWACYRNPKYQFSRDWLVLESTYESEVPMNLWIVWTKDIYIPVYCFNQYDSWRIDRDYAKLGLTQEYVEKYRGLIESMVNYVESGVKMREKWVHKKIRPVKPGFRVVRNRRWEGGEKK